MELPGANHTPYTERFFFAFPLAVEGLPCHPLDMSFPP